MSKQKKEEIFASLDIGTSKVCVVIAEQTAEGDLNIIGVGTAPLSSVKRGVVVDLGCTSEAIEQAIHEAEMMAGCDIHEVFVNISGSHIQGNNSHGAVRLRKQQVQESDLYHVLDSARAIPMPSEREILHVLPRQFSIDGQEGIPKPLGMQGIRLEADVHLVTASRTFLQNIKTCVKQSGLRVLHYVFDGIASSEAVLEKEEKELGVALVDIGAGTTDITLFETGSIAHSVVLPIGGNNITKDITVGLRTPTADAERIKMQFGCANNHLVQYDEFIQVPAVGGRRPRELNRRMLAEIIEPRLEELFSLVRQEIRQSGMEDLLASGIVLTGGTTNLDGICEFAEEVTGFPTRKGTPQGIGGLSDVVHSPAYATGVGLIQYGLLQNQNPLYCAKPPSKWWQHWKQVQKRLSHFF